MVLEQQSTNAKTSDVLSTPKSAIDEIVSFDECKKHFEKYDLDDKRVIEIKNNLVGIVNTIIDSYLEDFR
ncbi:MAG: hypothetical protein WCP93_02365 [Candidatus Berkelbacteria bacterium]